MTEQSEQSPLLGSRESGQVIDHIDADKQETSESRKYVGEIIESKKTHRILLSLIALDAAFVLMDLGYNVLNPECTPGEKQEAPAWLEVLSYISLSIDLLFLIEIPLTFYAFGAQWFGLSFKHKAVPHSVLHLFDALVIIGTAIFEVVLRGKERELAGLLVLLRLWRIIKLVGGVAVGVGEWDEAAVTTVAQARTRISELEKEVARLRALNGFSAEQA